MRENRRRHAKLLHILKVLFSASPRLCSPICFALSKSCNAKEATVSECFSSKLHDLPKCRTLLFLIGAFCSSRKPSKFDKYSANSPSRSSRWLTQISSKPNSSIIASIMAAPAIIMSARSGLIAGTFFFLQEASEQRIGANFFRFFLVKTKLVSIAVFLEQFV